MADRARRKELAAQYKETQPTAGVYRIVNSGNGKAFLSSSPDLASLRSKMAFARKTNTTGGVDYRLHGDFRAYGAAAFSLEILAVLEITPAMTREEIQRDLATLEDLWREQSDPALLS